MASDLRVTVAVASVLVVFLEDPGKPQYGFNLMEATDLPSGSLYPILARLERAGWLVGEKETVDPRTEGRPPRRYFTLTGEGIRLATPRLAALQQKLRTRPAGQRQPGWQGGLA
jgi:PadR family transcriptional regulator PadR